MKDKLFCLRDKAYKERLASFEIALAMPETGHPFHDPHFTAFKIKMR